MGFLIKGEHPALARTARIWNALAVISVVVIISSFALVGKNYGTVQELANKEPEKSRQAQKVINEKDALAYTGVAYSMSA